MSVTNGSEEALAQTLLLCSGLPTLSHVLADLTLHSHAGYVLKQVARSFYELVQVGFNAASHEMKILEIEESSTPPATAE